MARKPVPRKTVSIDAGDRAALLQRRDALVEAHLDLTHRAAKYIGASLPQAFELDDLISAGYLGLLKAATNYHPSVHNGTPFSAYAWPVVRGAILDSVRRRHYEENTRPKIDDLGSDVYAPEVNPEAEIDRRRLEQRVETAVAGLDRRHRKVVGWHYDGEERLPKIGRRLKLSKSRVSQIHMEAVRKLRLVLA